MSIISTISARSTMSKRSTMTGAKRKDQSELHVVVNATS